MDIGNPNSSQVIVNSLGEVVKVISLNPTEIESKVINTNSIQFRKEADNTYYLPSGFLSREGKAVQHKSFDIGTWNMDSDDRKTLTHNLGTFWNKIIDIQCFIQNDAQNAWYNLCTIDTSTGLASGGVGGIHSITIDLDRTLGGMFDFTDFNDSTINRGYLSIFYTLT